MRLAYALSLLVLLCQKPSLAYLLRPMEYRILFVLVVGFFITDFITRVRAGARRVGFSEFGVKQAAVFVLMTAALMLVSAASLGESDAFASLRLLVTLAQFFVVYHFVIAIGDVERIFRWFNGLAMVLSLGALWLWIARSNEWLPDPLVVGLLDNGYNYFFPFGFLPPEPITHFRSYSYFLEPGKYAAFLCPILVYAALRAVRDRSPWWAASAALHAVVVFSTASVAGFSALFLTMIFGAGLQLVLRRRLGPVLFLAATLSAGWLLSPKSQSQSSLDWTERRAASFDNRFAQLKYTLVHLITRPLGAGWNEKQEGYVYYNRLHSDALESGLTGFFLMYLQAFGWLGGALLSYYMGHLFGVVVHSIAGARAGTRAYELAHAAVCALFFNFSIDHLASPSSMLVLSCLLLHAKQPQTAVRLPLVSPPMAV